MGSDERAAYTSGVRIGVVRIGAHVVSGLFAGLASLAFTALISSGDPSQGTTYTLISVTALVLGGTSLAGGRATVFGSLLGRAQSVPDRLRAVDASTSARCRASSPISATASSSSCRCC